LRGVFGADFFGFIVAPSRKPALPLRLGHLGNTLPLLCRC
jgi:hypothetical protein